MTFTARSYIIVQRRNCPTSEHLFDVIPFLRYLGDAKDIEMKEIVTQTVSTRHQIIKNNHIERG